MLHLNFDLAWKDEKQLHTTDQYIATLQSIGNLEDCQCCFCGFKDGKFLELHHINHDHTDYSADNLDVICSFCHRTIHLGWAASDNCASLGYFPSSRNGQDIKHLDLAVINNITRVYLLANILGGQVKEHLSNTPIHDFFIKNLSTLTTHRHALDKNKEYIDDNTQNHNVFNRFLHPAELLEYLKQHPNQAARFLEEQASKTKGMFFLNFNTRVFLPFSDYQDYTLVERLEYYKEQGYHLDKTYTQSLQKEVDEFIEQKKQAVLAEQQKGQEDNTALQQPSQKQLE